jgi:hypothetical protein
VDNITQAAALAQMQTDLAGYDGYPNSEAGQIRFAREFQDCCISIGHMRAVTACFDTHFPTVREIRDTAASLKHQFEVAPDQRAEWEKKYGPPEPFDLNMEGVCLHCGKRWDDILHNAAVHRHAESIAYKAEQRQAKEAARTTGRRITQEDIDKAVQTLRAQRARGESPDASSDAA